MLTLDIDHVYRMHGREVQSVTQILTASGAIDTTWFTPEAAERGRRVHDAIAAYNEDPALADMAGDEVAPYLAAYREFLGVSGARVIEYERMVYCASMDYAGTPDLYCEIDGLMVIVDYKTGPVQEWCSMQTAAYAYAYREAGRKVHKRYGLHLSKTGSYRLHPYGDLRHDFARFVTHLLRARRLTGVA